MGNRAFVLSWIFFFVSAVQADTVKFEALYEFEDASTGFNDPVEGATRRAAFEGVLAEFSTLFESSYSGETVYVTAEFGSTGFVAVGWENWRGWNFGSPTIDNTTYNWALLNNMTSGVSATWLENFTGGRSDNPLIGVVFGDRYIDGSVPQDFYFGGDHVVQGSDLDFSSLAAHEVLHGLGFSSAAWSNNNFAVQYYPRIWDRFLADGSGKLWTAMNATEREAAAKSNDLFWIGANATAANGGVHPKIYSDPWQGNVRWGSGLIHFDEATYGAGELMTPFLGGPFGGGVISPMTRGALQDMGWTMAAQSQQPVPEPSTFVLVVFGAGAIAWRRRRRKQGSKRVA